MLVRTSDAELNVGDTVFVTYAAASTAGLWRSGVALSGAYERTQWRADTLFNNAQHTIAFVVPQLARLDRPVTVLLLADDIALERSTSLHATSIRAMDRQPPSAGGCAVFARIPTGNAFAFNISAQDDNAIRTLVWELDGEIAAWDSITLLQPLASVAREIIVSSRPEWAGKRARVRVRAYDDAGLRSNEWVSADGVCRFHESFVAPTARFAFETEGLPDFHTYDPVHGRFFGSCTSGSKVVGVALAAMVPLPPIAVNALDGVIDLGTAPNGTPDWIAPMVGGRVPVHLSSVQGVIEINLANGTQRHRPEFEPSGNEQKGFVSTGRQRLLLIAPDCHRWYVAAPDSLTTCRPSAGVDPRFVSLPLAGGGAGLGSQIVDASLAALGPADPQGMSIPDADGIHHWSADMWEGRIYKVRSADGAILKSTPLDGQSWFLRFLPDGHSLVVMGWGTLTRYDLAGR